MTLFTCDVGQSTVHIYNSDKDIFYPKKPEVDLINLNIDGLKKEDTIVIEDAHLRERVEGGKSVAHAFGFNDLQKLYFNAKSMGVDIKLFSQKKTPVTRRLAGYDSKDKSNKEFKKEYGISTDEADVRSIAKFLKRDPEALKRLKKFNPEREKEYQEQRQHIFDYVSEANLDINIARTQGYGFDPDYEYSDAISEFIENQKYELCKRLTVNDGLFRSNDNKFTGEELMSSLGLTYNKKGKGLNKISSESRLYTLISSILKPKPNEDVEDEDLKDLRLREFPPIDEKTGQPHKYHGKKMFPNWRFIKSNYFAIKPLHEKGGVAASNYKQHMRPGVSKFEGKTLPVNCSDGDYAYFKEQRRRVDRILYTIWKILRTMIVEDGLR